MFGSRFGKSPLHAFIFKAMTGSHPSCAASSLTPVCRAVGSDQHRRPVWKVRWWVRRQCGAASGFSHRPPVLCMCFTLVRSHFVGRLCDPARSLLYWCFLRFLLRSSPRGDHRGSGRAPVDVPGVNGLRLDSTSKPLCSISNTAEQQRRRSEILHRPAR